MTRSLVARRAVPRTEARRRSASRVQSLALVVVAALAALGFLRPLHSRSILPHREPGLDLMPLAEPSSQAFGRSGAVQVRFALPGAAVEYPLRLSGDPTALVYEWVRIADAVSVDVARPLDGDTLTAPGEPGFYRLALVREGVRSIIDGLTVAVLLPFEEKRGATIDGYRIGTYLAERVGGAERDRPEGFVKVTPHEAHLPVTKHFRLADFLTRDGQTTWPRYAAVSPKLLDKVELVLAELARARSDSTPFGMQVSVHSGFRSPQYNRTVRNAASDSRHQYGDAMDVAIDADGDGRITARDAQLVVRAVEAVERAYPELAGGVGVYTNRNLRHPYVHIDARGQRVRWRG